MNEQLKKLAEQSTEVKWLHDGQYALVMPDKFAELLVRECAKFTDHKEEMFKYFGVKDV